MTLGDIKILISQKLKFAFNAGNKMVVIFVRRCEIKVLPFHLNINC